MKTLYIVYTDLGIGGIQSKIIDIINHIGRHHHDTKIFLVLREKSRFNRTNKITNSNVHISYYDDSFVSRFPACFPLYITYMFLLHFPDAVLTFTFVPTISVLINKAIFFFKHIQVVVSEDWSKTDDLEEDLGRYFALIRRFLFNSLYQTADIICVVNTQIKKVLENKYHIHTQKIQCVDNWASDLYRTRVGANSKHTYDLIYVGRLEKIKNVRYILSLIHAIKSALPYIKLCIVGEGGDKISLRRYVKSCKLETNVHFAGFSDNPSFYLQKSKIFVLASKNEGLPIAALEAMQYKLPIICANFPSAREIVIDGYNGYIYRSKSECIRFAISLLRQNHKRKRMGDNGYLYVNKRYSNNNILQYLNFLAIYR